MRFEDFSVLKLTGEFGDLSEKRYAYNGSNQTEYVGLTNIPNAGTDLEVWLILKYNYSGGLLSHVQLPDDGAKFAFAWDDRATYFS